jgi:hypothetical protein
MAEYDILRFTFNCLAHAGVLREKRDVRLLNAARQGMRKSIIASYYDSGRIAITSLTGNKETEHVQ